MKILVSFAASRTNSGIEEDAHRDGGGRVYAYIYGSISRWDRASIRNTWGPDEARPNLSFRSNLVAVDWRHYDRRSLTREGRGSFWKLEASKYSGTVLVNSSLRGHEVHFFIAQ